MNYGEEKFDLVCVFTAAALLSVVAEDAQKEKDWRWLLGSRRKILKADSES